MILYRNLTVIVEAPKSIKPEYGRDFELGVYITDIKEQAVR